MSVRQRFLTGASALAVFMAAGCANSKQGCCSRPAPPPPCCPGPEAGRAYYAHGAGSAGSGSRARHGVLRPGAML